jgi:urease accessory protein UreF
MQLNCPTADLIKSLAEVAETLHDSFTSLLSAAMRLAEVGQHEEARRLVELAKDIQSAEHKMRTHTKDARVGKIVKLNVH